MYPEDLAEFRRAAYKSAEAYEKQHFDCVQSVFTAIKQTLPETERDLYSFSNTFTGVVGLKSNSCGALIGGVMALSYYLSRKYNCSELNEDIRIQVHKLASRLSDKFLEEFGSSLCDEIQINRMGKSYCLSDKEELIEFLQVANHSDKCPLVCGLAAAFVIEILGEENII